MNVELIEECLWTWKWFAQNSTARHYISAQSTPVSALPLPPGGGAGKSKAKAKAKKSKKGKGGDTTSWTAGSPGENVIVVKAVTSSLLKTDVVRARALTSQSMTIKFYCREWETEDIVLSAEGFDQHGPFRIRYTVPGPPLGELLFIEIKFGAGGGGGKGKKSKKSKNKNKGKDGSENDEPQDDPDNEWLFSYLEVIISDVHYYFDDTPRWLTLPGSDLPTLKPPPITEPPTPPPDDSEKDENQETDTPEPTETPSPEPECPNCFTEQEMQDYETYPKKESWLLSPGNVWDAVSVCACLGRCDVGPLGTWDLVELCPIPIPKDTSAFESATQTKGSKKGKKGGSKSSNKK